MLQITQIWRYPIKSCQGFQVEQAWLDSRGLVGDRRWMLIDAKGRMVTQRQYPKLALVEATEVSLQHLLKQPVKPGLLPLSVKAPGMPELIVNPLAQQQRSSSPLRRVQIWLDTCHACLAENSAHQWFSKYLAQPTWLVEQPNTMQRPIDPNYASLDAEGHYQQVAFSDGFPLLLISQESLDDLNDRISHAKHAASIAMASFRPNLVIGGCDAYAEDQARQLIIQGDNLQSFNIVKPCSRCVIPSINLRTGQIQQEPTRTLKTYRQGVHGDRNDPQIYFGQNLLLGHTLLTQTKLYPQPIRVGSRAELRE